jgi:hypothetical protein
MDRLIIRLRGQERRVDWEIQLENGASDRDVEWCQPHGSPCMRAAELLARRAAGGAKSSTVLTSREGR